MQIDTIKNIFLELQTIKQDIDDLYQKVVEEKYICKDEEELLEIINCINTYIHSYLSKELLLDSSCDYLSSEYKKEADDCLHKARRMHYSAMGGYQYIIYYLDGTDLSTVNLEYKKGISF